MTGRQAAEAHRVRGYAMKYVNDSTGPPTDVNLAKVLATCARTPKTEWLPAVRAEVLAWREENGRLSRLETNGGVSGRLLPRKPAAPDSSDDPRQAGQEKRMTATGNGHTVELVDELPPTGGDDARVYAAEIHGAGASQWFTFRHRDSALAFGRAARTSAEISGYRVASAVRKSRTLYVLRGGDLDRGDGQPDASHPREAP